MPNPSIKELGLPLRPKNVVRKTGSPVKTRTQSALDKSPGVLLRGSFAPLESILCTEELNRRPMRSPDYQTENAALVSLAQALAESPRTILQLLADKILEVFQAGSAGISLLTKEDGGKRFFWPAISGAWKPHIGGGTPRDFGPCGDVLDHDVPLLFQHIERRYTYFHAVTPAAEEALLVPFYTGGKAVGTIWAVTHDDRHKFDAEDMRQLVSLGRFASSAYQVVASLDVLEQQGETLRQNHTELSQSLEELRKANVTARDSRHAALNLMEDAVQTRQAMETLNVELRESEGRYRTLFAAAPMAVFVCDRNAVIQQYNQRAVELWGREPVCGVEQHCGSVKLWFPNGKLLPHAQSPIVEVLRTGIPARNVEVFIERPDGSRLPVLVNFAALKDAQGEITGAITSFMDITDRKRMETELLAWQRELEARVAQQKAQLLADAEERKRLEAGIAGAVESEQERLGQELHDGLAQELTGIGMMLDVLADTLMKQSPAQGREASRLRVMLGKATASTRDLAKNFYPVELEKHGLLLALQELAKHNQERFGILCAVEARETCFARLKDARAIQLFRIAQEAIHNAAKHSQAKHIHIHLTTQEGNWVLTVKDDGVGLRRDRQQASGIGLRIMQHRANRIGGTLQVGNADGGGVIISCAVPAVQAAAAQTRKVQKKILRSVVARNSRVIL
jgi:PAS domain S-box-containing protein